MSEFALESGEATVQELVDAVLEDAEFDATPAQALRWLTDRQRQMCARSLCYRATLNLGNTVQGQDIYPLPGGIIRILQVTVGDQVYDHARHSDFSNGAARWIWLSGPGGLAGREDLAAGVSQLRVFPIPAEGSEPQAIVAYAVMQAPALAIGEDSTIVVPLDYKTALIEGAIATGNRRESRHDLAQPCEEIFNTACNELKLATRRKFRTAGSLQLRTTC